jgi:sugar lactone lactonase YvrE
MGTGFECSMGRCLPVQVLLVCVGTLACSASSSPRGELWYAGPNLCGFSHEQVQRTAEGRPAIVLSTAALTAVSDIAFDDKGNAWVVGIGSDDVLRFPASALGPSGAVTPDLVVRSTALSEPGNLVFDGGGALWVANRGALSGAADGEGSIVRFDIPSGASGLLTIDPIAQLSSDTPGDLYGIGGMALDPDQNLWVTSFAGIVRFDRPRDARGAVALSPGAVIDKNGYTDNSYFYSVAFDAMGTLFSASGDGLHYLTRVNAFANPSTLSGRSSPPPLLTIMGEEDLLPAGGLVFDHRGDLWMATGVSILRYANPSAGVGILDAAPSLTLSVTSLDAPTTNSHLLFSPGLTGADGG